MSFWDMLFPTRCVFCHTSLTREAATPPCVCVSCRKSLPWCTTNGPDVYAPLYYRDAARSAIHRYKFNGSVSYAKTFGLLMAQIVPSGDFDAVTFVPCSLPRRLKRRFDQSELLARVLAKHLQLPLYRLLRRKRHSKAQFRQKDTSARRENVKYAYAVRAKVAKAPTLNARILLVDDIHTSGATFEECRRVFQEAGWTSVRLVCIAKTRP